MEAESSPETRTMILVQGVWRMKQDLAATDVPLRPAKIPLTPSVSLEGNETVADFGGSRESRPWPNRSRGLFLNHLV